MRVFCFLGGGGGSGAAASLSSAAGGGKDRPSSKRSSSVRTPSDASSDSEKSRSAGSAERGAASARAQATSHTRGLPRRVPARLRLGTRLTEPVSGVGTDPPAVVQVVAVAERGERDPEEVE